MTLPRPLSSARLLLLAVALLAGCASDALAPEGAPAAVLRGRFPAQAAKVLGGEAGFVAGNSGFVLERPGSLGVELPRTAGGAVVLRGVGGFEVRVRERGIQGEGALAERAVAYRRAGGTSFWTATAGGAEEWLHLEPGVVRTGHVVATWEVEGATVRQRGNAVELVDHGGRARLRVTAPMSYGAAGREVTTRIAARQERIELSVDADGEAVLVDPKWTLTTGVLGSPRQNHTATLLGDGTVLVRGGDSGILKSGTSAELYDPSTQEWSDASFSLLTIGRESHTATLLLSGEVLVVGGLWNASGKGVQSSVELYHLTSPQWSMAQPLTQARARHTATRLGDGTVLVAGGAAAAALDSVEIYDPSTKMWMPGQHMNSARYEHTATLLNDGTVLVTGGNADSMNVLSSAEIYDPSTKTWTLVKPMGTPRTFHTATLLADGTVLVAGGQGPALLQTAEIYDPGAKSWNATLSPMNDKRRRHTATRLKNGQVLLAGGDQGAVLNTAELYDPNSGYFLPTTKMTEYREDHTATPLPNDDVLAVGGSNSPTTSELFHMNNGAPCAKPADCDSGFCVEQVCCDLACNTDPCQACSVAAGAQVDGICGPVSGKPCAGSGSSSSSTSGGTTSSSSSTGGGTVSSSSGAGGAPGAGGNSAGGGAGTGGSTNFYGCTAAPTTPPHGRLGLLALGLLLLRRRRCADA